MVNDNSNVTITNKYNMQHRIDQLHDQAIGLMTKYDAKYNMDNLMSLDEYLHEYCDLLTNNEQLEVSNLINEFNKYY